MCLYVVIARVVWFWRGVLGWCRGSGHLVVLIDFGIGLRLLLEWCFLLVLWGLFYI